MSETPQAPLPFVFQFAAGAVAGVSEVCLSCFAFEGDSDLIRCVGIPHEVLC